MSTCARAQVGLGIATLLCAVPPALGSLHQLNVMNLLGAAVVLLHALRRAPSPAAAATRAAGARWAAAGDAARPAAA